MTTSAVDPLVRDLVQWCVAQPRRYGEVLDAWRTSCPRLMVWEEAKARGLVETWQDDLNGGLWVAVTERGRELAGAVPMPAGAPAAAKPKGAASPGAMPTG
ncbi:MAG: hypothetical protein ACK5JT_05750 [Hyphomicrobiaceae bacterium]